MNEPTALSPYTTVTEAAQRPPLDIRMVLALAGDRELNARELQVIDKLKGERGESLFSDMLYTLTHKMFPSRQAKTLWAEIGDHRTKLERLLGRDPGITLAAHDYLANVSGQLRTVGLIEENTFNTFAEVATHDGLTALYDKTTFTRLLHDELARQARYNRPCTLVLADIDHFKRINDTYGHADGDIVLQQVAAIIQKHRRTTDTAGRFGGEEFAIVLPEVDAKAGQIFAERLRTAVENHFENGPYERVTLSLGVACIAAEETLDDLVRKTDEALYTSKRQGRNRTTTA